MVRKRWIRVAGALVLTVGALIAVAPVAFAGSGTPCAGTGCDGLDPAASYNSGTGIECSSGVRNVSDLPNGKSALGGLLELRYGPNCVTNWTRFTPGDNDEYQIFVQRVSDGTWAGTGLGHYYDFSNAKGVGHYSDQVYSPGPAKACVRDVTFNTGFVCFKQTD